MYSGSNESTLFRFYQSGIHLANVFYENYSWSVERKDPFKNLWKTKEPMDLEKWNFPLAIKDVCKIMEKFEDKTIAGNMLLLKSQGFSFQKHQKITRWIKGKELIAQIWAQKGRTNPLDIVTLEGSLIGFIQTNRFGSSFLIRDGYEDLTPLKIWKEALITDNNRGIKSLGSFFIPTSDGIKLKTHVWLPGDIKEKEQVPAILIRTPYGINTFSKPELRFVQRGYALIVQETRGRGESEGEWIPMFFEREDGNDTLNWIAEQNWSNKKIGMIGASYDGFVQWAAAASGNPYLKAMVSQVTAGSPFVDIPRKGGAFMAGLLAWVFMVSEKDLNYGAKNRKDWNEILNYRPIIDIPKKALGREIPFWKSWMNHQDKNEFWDKSDWTLHWDKIKTPALIISGWYDDNGMGSTEAWETLNQARIKNKKMILGPWIHMFNTTREIHNIDLGTDTIRYDLDLLYLKWFDHLLKGHQNGMEKEPSVEYFMVGTNSWEADSQWPPLETEYQSLYLNKDSLKKEKPGDQLPDSFHFDPENPCPHLIDVSENEMAVPENYRDVEKRDDVLLYTSDPLKENLVIAGDIWAELYASSSARDTDWVVRLTELDPEGNSIRISDGLIRARYRNSFSSPEFLSPGKVEKYNIRMSKIAITIKKGNRLRVQVTSGAKNLIFPNQNTGNDPAIDVQSTVAKQEIFHSREFPSHLKLPVLKTRADLTKCL